MSQIKCTECGQLMPEGVNRCPNCGCPVENAPAEQKTTAQPAQETPEVEQQSTNSMTKNPPMSVYPQPNKRQYGGLEIACYCFAAICGIAWIFTQTTRSDYVNFDGSNIALRREIATFAWLIIGRLTALIDR